MPHVIKATSKCVASRRLRIQKLGGLQLRRQRTHNAAASFVEGTEYFPLRCQLLLSVHMARISGRAASHDDRGQAEREKDWRARRERCMIG